MTDPVLLPIARAFRRAALPLAAYYTVTLVLPLANGAARADPTFVRHALVVLLVPPAIVVSISAARTLFQRAGVFVVTMRTRPHTSLRGYHEGHEEHEEHEADEEHKRYKRLSSPKIP